jgi:hypothetical protein
LSTDLEKKPFAISASEVDRSTVLAWARIRQVDLNPDPFSISNLGKDQIRLGRLAQHLILFLRPLLPEHCRYRQKQNYRAEKDPSFHLKPPSLADRNATSCLSLLETQDGTKK